MRKLASIQKIIDIRPIQGADAIEVARINNWNVVIKKGEYQVGDLCIYCEIDSFLPINKHTEFLRKSSYKKMLDVEGFRLRTVKLRGQISQGLILPLTVLNDVDPDSDMIVGVSKQPHGDQLQLGPYDNAIIIEEGLDVTNMLGIVKYEAPIPAELVGLVKGEFPSYLVKTDEERIQNLTNEYQTWLQSSYRFYVTEKLDGASMTCYLYKGEFGVCTRNLDLIETEKNSLWKVARQLNIEEGLSELQRNIAIQGEIIGEGIQGNPYKIKGQTFRLFNVFYPDTYTYATFDELSEIATFLNIDTVPIVDSDFKLPESIDDLLEFADAKSTLNPAFDREGIVVRNYDKTISFKVISNKFLLNEK